MKENICRLFPFLESNWVSYAPLFSEKHVGSRTVLLHEGDVARRFFLIKRGCLRMAFDYKGREFTSQFFFEGDVVASFESFRNEKPSASRIESIEPSDLIVLERVGFDRLMADFPEMKDLMLEFAFRRFENYAHLFVSYIRETPAQRYKGLMVTNPQIIQRVPQHYIASYLGITPVSLSRIRNRLMAGIS